MKTFQISKKILYIFALSSFCIFPKVSFSDDGVGDSLGYKTQEENLDTKKQLLKPKGFGERAHHFYGYVGFDTGYESNPDHAVKTSPSQDLSDKYLTGKTYLLYSLDLSPNTAWTTATNMVYRFHEHQKDLDDGLFKIETGPSLQIPSLKLAISARPVFYATKQDQKRYYSSKYPGGILKFNYTPTENLNILGLYEYEERDYESKNTTEPDRTAQKILFRLRYNNDRNVLSFFPSYRKHNTEIDYLDRDIYGMGLTYIHYLTKKIYVGGSYEKINSYYSQIAPNESKKREDDENYYTILLGYQFQNDWIVEAGYTREKIYSNMDDIATTYNNVFRLSAVYRFHFHKARGE